MSAPIPTAIAASLDPRYAEALINYEHVVMGRRLRPYSLHHRQLLRIVHSPLIGCGKPDQTVTWEDLWEAAIICSTAHGEPLRWPNGLWCAARQLWGRWEIRDQIERFLAYLRDYEALPDLTFTGDDTRRLTAPPDLAKVVFLARHLHMPLASLWDMPVGVLEWTYATTQEQVSDRASLLDEEESALYDLLSRIQRGLASPDELPPDPDTKARQGRLLARARAALGVEEAPAA